MFAGTAGLGWLDTWPWWSQVLASYLNKAQVNAPAWSPGLDCDTPTALHAWSHPHSTLGLPAPRHVLICALCPRETLSKALLLFSHSVVSDSLQPHGLQHARLPCPSPSPRVCSNSCPLSQWCDLTILSSAACFSFYLQSFPASRSCLMSRIFTSGGQSIGIQLESFQ